MATSGEFSGEIIKIEHAEGSSSILVRDEYDTSIWVEFDHQEMILVRDEWFVPGQDVTVTYRSYDPEGPQGNRAMVAVHATANDPEGRVSQLAYQWENGLSGGDRAVEDPASTWSMFEAGRVAESFALGSEDLEEATEAVNESIDEWLRAHPGDQGMFQIVPNEPEDLAFLPEGEVYFDGSGDLPTYWLTPDGSGAFPIQREPGQEWMPWKQTWVVDGERLSVTVTEGAGQRLGSAQIVPVPEGKGLDARAAHLALIEGPRHLREQAEQDAPKTGMDESRGRIQDYQTGQEISHDDPVLGTVYVSSYGTDRTGVTRYGLSSEQFHSFEDSVPAGYEDTHYYVLSHHEQIREFLEKNYPEMELIDVNDGEYQLGFRTDVPEQTSTVQALAQLREHSGVQQFHDDFVRLEGDGRERLSASLAAYDQATAERQQDLSSMHQVIGADSARTARLKAAEAVSPEAPPAQSTVRGTLVSTPREVETASHGRVVVTRLVQEPTQAGEVPRYYDVAMDPSTGGLGVNARYSLKPGDQVVVVGRESREPYVVAGEGRIQHRMWAQDVLVSLKENSVEGISPDAPAQVRSPSAGVDPVQYAVEQNRMSTPAGPEAAGPSR